MRPRLSVQTARSALWVAMVRRWRVLLVPAMALSAQAVGMLLPLLLLPSARRVHRAFVSGPRGVAMNEVLFATFRLELWFAALLSAGALLGRWVA